VAKIATPPAEQLIAQLVGDHGQAGAYPAGGAVAALAAALAASLAAAAADRSRADWDEAAGIRAQAQALGRRAAGLVEQDRLRYGQAREALDQRRSDIPPDHIRDWSLGLAIRSAAEPPLELAATAADIAELSATIARRGAGDVRADAVIAACLAAAAARAAAVLVRVNLVVGGESEAAVLAARYARAAVSAAESVDESAG
jgi:formiminotetrahydrofolate cyclodeaminase